MLARYCAAHPPKESARVYSYRIIKIQILNMQLLPGEKLSEAEIAHELGVSRTPIHDTFARLAREKMLEIAPQRGTFIPRLHSGRILEAAHIDLKLSLAVLETIYVQKPAGEKWQPLVRCVEQELADAAAGTLTPMVRLIAEFQRELFRLAGYLPVYQAMHRISADLSRMCHLVDDVPMARRLAAQHEAIVRALQRHDSDTACAVMADTFSLVGPLLVSLQKRYPRYFI